MLLAAGAAASFALGLVGAIATLYDFCCVGCPAFLLCGSRNLAPRQEDDTADALPLVP